MSSEYATLEEAVGVSSFLAPEPPILRGGVAKVSDDRQKRLREEVRATQRFSGVGAPGRNAEPLRLPVETARCPAGVPCDAEPSADFTDKRSEMIARAHAAGGAAAAWKLIPESARGDMMWYAITHALDSDVALIVIVGLCLYILVK